MSIENDFDAKAYATRLMKAKGFDTEADDAYTDIFELQWPAWQELINRHRIGDDLSRAEQLLTTFIQREVKGGPGRVIEAFAAHLNAQPKQGGSPDWSQAGKEWAECCYCDGRGVVSDVPCRVMRRGEVVERSYSFACVCERGRFFGGMRPAESWMLTIVADRKKAEIDGHEAKLRRYGIDPHASPTTRAGQFRRTIGRMLAAVKSGEVTAKIVQPILPRTVEEARSILAERRDRASLAQGMDPDRVALAIFKNGDERNEWD